MLEEIEVAPDLLLRVIDGAVLAADRTREVAPLGEIDVQVQPLLLHGKPYIVHRPRWNQAQCQCEQLIPLVHRFPQLAARSIRQSYRLTHSKCRGAPNDKWR